MKLNVILGNALELSDTECETRDSTINLPKSAWDARNGIFAGHSVYSTYVKYFGTTTVNRHTTLGVCFCSVWRAVCVHKVATPTIRMPTLDTGKPAARVAS